MNWKTTLPLSTLVLLAAAGATALIFSTEPTAARGGATKKTAMLVEVTPAERGNARPLLVTTGTVEPEQDVVLSPRVGGQLIRRSPRFTPGRFVEEGEVLVRIDPADYKNMVQQRRSELRQALTQLNLEMGRQNVAQSEFELLEGDLSDEERARALRRPQLEAARGQVQAARAALDQAKLDLKRTTLRAPFDGEILRRDVSVGSQVSPGDPMGRIVGVDAYRVALTVAHSKLKWLSVAEDPEEKGSRVRVRNRGAWPEGVYRTGHLDRVVGALDDQTRMVRILVSIPDPLARAPETPDDAPELMIGEFLEARIRGKELENVVRLRRDHVRDGDTVWVMEKGKLAIRDVEVVARDERHAYISDGLRDGAKVVTTNLATITEGAKLRTEQASDSQGEAADASKSN